MNYFIELLSRYIENEALLRMLFVLMVGLAAFAAIASVIMMVSVVYSPIRRRLAGIAGADSETAERGLRDAPELSKKSSAFSEGFDAVAKYVMPQSDKERLGVKAQLVRAGFRDEDAFRTFYAFKTLLCLILGLVATQVPTFFPGISANKALVSILGAAAAGLIIPNMVLDYLESTRIKAIRRAFPDALDLFVVCVESGLGLAATIQRVGVEMDVSHPELAEELGLVNAEMRLGADRITALKGLATRTGLDEIRGLVALLDQSARFGTGIAETLRVYAEEFRDKRMQAAEEMAAKVGTKLIFPLTFCIWPSFFVVAVGPAILKVMEAFR